MNTTYTVNKDVEVYINARYDVKVRVKDYTYDYKSASFSDATGWQLDLNDGMKYAVHTKVMADGLLKFLTTECSPVRIKKLKDALMNDYNDFMDLLHNFTQVDDEVSKYKTKMNIHKNGLSVTSVFKIEIQIETRMFVNRWSAYLRYRNYGMNNASMQKNYFFNNVNVLFDCVGVLYNEK